MSSSSRSQGIDVLATAVRQFQAHLEPTENARLLAHSSKPDATSILAFTAEVDSINAHRRSRCVSSRLFGVLQSVQDFTAIADTLVSAHPEIAALVWGSVKFTILTVNNVTSFFDKISACFLRLGCHCPRYSEYQLLFQDSPRLQNSLCMFYATLVDFCAKAIKVIDAPGSTLVKALIRPFEKEFGDFETKLKEQNEEIKEEITLAAEKAAAKEREDASKYRISGLLFRNEVKQLSREAREKSLGKEKRTAEARRQKLLDQLSSYDYISPLKRIRKKRYRKTSSWVTENEHFKSWLNDTKSGTFWLSGILGSGKSVVCAATLDHLLCMPRGDKDHIAFFFCQFDDAESLLARTVIGALIRQCLSADTLPQIVETRMVELFKSGSPDVEELEEFFVDVVGASNTAQIIIDGLDECSRPARMAVASYHLSRWPRYSSAAGTA